MATALVSIGDFKKAAEHEQRAIDIATQTLSVNHPNLQTYKNYLERIQLKIDSIEQSQNT
jgi:hypothetical protein